MSDNFTAPVYSQNGRKGISYDWQSLYAEADNDALFQQKVTKVAQMYPTVINRIYRAVMDAEKEFVELATKLGKLDG